MFMLEHGLKRVHAVTRPYSSEELLQIVEDFLLASQQQHDMVPMKKATIVLWGHGNHFDDSMGFFKIYDRQSKSRFLLINDLLMKLMEMSEQAGVCTQLLMTQCWAHCHSQSLYLHSPYLVVDWLTSATDPETSARRWDSITTGNEMCQPDFDGYLEMQENYENLHRLTESRYYNHNADCYFLLKYLHYSSIHVEAMRYLYRQRHQT